jgi:hypothetical protein
MGMGMDGRSFSIRILQFAPDLFLKIYCPFSSRPARILYVEELARKGNLETGLLGWLAIHPGVSLQTCIIVETNLDLIRAFQT